MPKTKDSQIVFLRAIRSSGNGFCAHNFAVRKTRGTKAGFRAALRRQTRVFSQKTHAPAVPKRTRFFSAA
uniref:Uncharacterized protein n=1 Tax=Caudovirales sp. ctu3532 TaxID=2827639 RepID=A0A8S5THY8_9CAUD|nr:MAG TPA: hypothetical protein [Caudovirales sp. ctu3532]